MTLLFDPTTITLFTAWGALAAAAISPGPNMVAVASRGLGSGRKSALTVTLGIAMGGFCWAMLTSLGLGALFKQFPILLTVLGFMGGAYLFWLGFKGWRAALTGTSSDIAPVEGKGFWGDVAHGMIVTGTNPKAGLMWISIATFVSGSTSSLAVLVLFALVAAFIVFVIYGSYGLIFSMGGMRRLYDRFQRAAEATFGTIFGALGIGMVMRTLKG